MLGWVVRWISPTGIEGGGSLPLHAALAVSWIAHLNSRSDLNRWQHWLEKVES